ncbi:MAG: hypothetical protein ACXACU_01525 [Candidatus Hodarchaeales archaeon]
MDENKDNRFENRNDPDHLKDKETQSSPIDFWSSRGNIGEKLNVLIGLNVISLDMISKLFDILRDKEEFSRDIVEDLTFFQEFLSKIIAKPESSFDINDKLKKLESKVASILSDITGESILPEDIPFSSSDSEPMEMVGEIFQRKPEYTDKIGVIESIKALISSYSNLSHLGFPNYYLAACEEIHHYEIMKDSSLPDKQAVIQIPTIQLKKIISKLLREAPSARLLQNLRRMFPAEYDSTPSTTEKDQIKEIIIKYYLSVSEYSTESQSLSNSLSMSRNILREYNLGAGDLESRIPNVSFSIVKEIHEDLQNVNIDDFKRFVYSETIILIHRLNDSILQNERFIFFLRRLK